MPQADVSRCRLCLVTPPAADPDAFAPKLARALGGGDVASVVIATGAGDPAALQRAAEKFVPIVQARGAAALILNDTRIAGRAGADGVHVDGGPADLADAIAALRPRKIVGAGDIRSRHDAMVAGEADPDYVFFGRLDGDTGPEIFDKALDLAAWWSSMFIIPAIVMGGRDVASVRAAADAGIEFVALCRAAFDSDDPAAAVAEANRLLSATLEPAS